MKDEMVAGVVIITIAGTTIVIKKGPEWIEKGRKKIRDIIRQEIKKLIKNLVKDELKSFRDELRKAFG
jgi:predicted mannosyl-3-phosphoglycerate phosphatase (HAD superfamily)